jgi:prepilin-type processing-associated H-X9-DG protein/prepilin-type N-terminal cleavage/methylation domain-containing protein
MNWRSRRGFTVVELTAVLALFAGLISLAVPALDARLEDANRQSCAKILMSFTTASDAFSNDNKATLPHGMNNPWVKGEYFGTAYYAQSAVAPAQVCGIGQLMEGNYLPEKREAISCPQTDFREDKGYNAQCWMPLVDFTSKAPNDASDRSLTQGLDPKSPTYYRNITVAKDKYGLVSTYGIRGPALRTTALSKTVGAKEVALKPIQTALFVDHEGADQKLITDVEKNGKKVLDGWGRVHREGLNVAYVDGHVELFRDEDRTKTWDMSQVKYYGTSVDVQAFDLSLN